ncbi:MAG: hypothetical protein Q8M31_08765 [Beijerinckiaceae bacterium]|nr:hypothetical protein [Beijerinckiaceae bacterium]
MVTIPIHTAAIGLKNVRFFAAPLAGPHMPWVSFDDLLHAASLDRKRRRFFLTAFHEGLGDHRKVRTIDGPTTSVSHPAAQAFFEALRDLGLLPIGLDDAYTHGAADAMKILTRDMSDDAAHDLHVRRVPQFAGHAASEDGRREMSIDYQAMVDRRLSHLEQLGVQFFLLWSPTRGLHWGFEWTTGRLHSREIRRIINAVRYEATDEFRECFGREVIRRAIACGEVPIEVRA